MDELRELLRNVSDTYDDFVDGVCCIVKKHKECLDDVIQFIKGDPNRESSDILEYLDELGI
jgi:hypothetical protein|nr:MAG TPA: hypothetical protein [Caudoviricetes sp.]